MLKSCLKPVPVDFDVASLLKPKLVQNSRTEFVAENRFKALDSKQNSNYGNGIYKIKCDFGKQRFTPTPPTDAL